MQSRFKKPRTEAGTAPRTDEARDERIRPAGTEGSAGEGPRRLEGIALVADDEADRRLLDHVHPEPWTNPEPARRYHLVVIGAGTAGLVTSAAAAGLGARVALVERALMGGDCLNVGCVPSKSLLRASRAAAEVRAATRFGVAADGIRVDFGGVMRRVREVRARIAANDSARRYRDELGVDVFLGRARFVDGSTVEVDGRRLRFRKAVIATGARAAHPPIPGLAEAGFLTNETVFALTELPRRLAVIGGGPIGCELAQAFARLGAEVWLLEVAPQVLAREDPDAAAIVARSLERDGVRLCLNALIERVDRPGAARALAYACGGVRHEMAVDEILVGAGRAPNVDGLELERAGVAYDERRGIEVDEWLRTSNKRIYAAGDVCLAWKFTHAADAAARIVVQNALFGALGARRRLSALHMPWCTYTDPEVAHVGLYEREARARGIDVRTFEVPLAEVDRAVADGADEGFVRIHVQAGTDRILGATVVARHAGEMIGELSLAMASGIGLGKIAGAIHPYPTQAEAIRKAADAYNRTRLTPRVARLFRVWLRLTG